MILISIVNTKCLLKISKLNIRGAVNKLAELSIQMIVWVVKNNVLALKAYAGFQITAISSLDQDARKGSYQAVCLFFTVIFCDDFSFLIKLEKEQKHNIRISTTEG